MRRKSSIQKKLWYVIGKQMEDPSNDCRAGIIMGLKWVLGAKFNDDGEIVDCKEGGTVISPTCGVTGPE
jgi:hypothetical protein